MQFNVVAEHLEKLRARWDPLVPADDPMRCDEVAMRILENQILRHLAKQGASSNQLRSAHCLMLRLSNELVKESNRSTQAFTQCTVVANMKKSYERIRKDLRTEPDKQVMTNLDKMAKLLESA